ncbi:hypothetical protein [Shimazuella alba]|uniref:Uncharacterized protein n=1 Tax=Shimazuella alba TaxID=2690964 RepID=A0A6I4VYY2_9BACL|nr:hypothetical protein [Shimazuella alba]MXQ55991.1 hypothetical protein [Shimazuella alba]
MLKKGQELGEFVAGDTGQLAANYLKVLSGLMTLKLSEDDEQLPDVDLLLRLVVYT